MHHATLVMIDGGLAAIGNWISFEVEVGLQRLDLFAMALYMHSEGKDLDASYVYDRMYRVIIGYD